MSTPAAVPATAQPTFKPVRWALMRVPSILYTTAGNARATVSLGTPVHVACNLQHVAGPGREAEHVGKEHWIGHALGKAAAAAPGRHALAFGLVACQRTIFSWLSTRLAAAASVLTTLSAPTRSPYLLQNNERVGYVGMACSKRVAMQHAGTAAGAGSVPGHRKMWLAQSCTITAAACRPRSWRSSGMAAARSAAESRTTPAVTNARRSSHSQPHVLGIALRQQHLQPRVRKQADGGSVAIQVARRKAL